jgi:hypothetical protein
MPNAEVKEEWGEIIKKRMAQQDLGNLRGFFEIWYGKLTYNSKITDIIKSIKTKNAENLQKLLESEPELICDSKNLKLNFFHITAISGSKEIFNKLRDYCRDDSLSARDKLGAGLTPIDYAYLANNKEIKNMLEQEGYAGTSLDKPWPIISTVICHEYSPVTPSLVIPIAVINVAMHVLPLNFPVLMLVGMAYIMLNSKGFTECIDKTFCSSYQAYNAIPQHSLLGYKKFVDAHADAYVALDIGCDQGREVMSLGVPYLYNEDKELLRFSLCTEQPKLVGEIIVL